MENLEQITPSIGSERIQRFRQQGGKVLGYACLLTPIEVMDAAGLYPYRVVGLGNARTDLADARLSRYNCGYCRSCLQLVLEGKYDFLDGVIETNGCDQLRGMFENWQHSHASPFFHYFKVPHLISEDALSYLSLKVRRMIEDIEAGFDVKISDEKLWDAIRRQERIRGLLCRLYALREEQQPRIAGSEVLRIMTVAGALLPAEFEASLEDLLPRVEARAPRPAASARLLLGGAATDEIELVRDIESLGAEVVADSLCFGSRAFRPMLAHEAAEDPVRTLAARYLETSLCPRMYEEFDRRLEAILSEARRADVRGAILVHNKFCDIHGIDNALLRTRLEERGVPVLTLEKEYGAVADRGRIKTRVQAFMERIGS